MTKSSENEARILAGVPGIVLRPIRARPRTTAHVALVAAALIWGSTFVVTKQLLAEAPPFFIVLARFAIALAVLWPLFARRGTARAAFSPRPGFVALGLLGVAANFGLQTVGLSFTGAADAALIIALTPVPVALLAATFLGEQLGSREWLGIGTSIGGVALITGIGGESSAGAIGGDLLIAASTLAWAGYTLLARRLAAEHDAGTIAIAAISWGIVFLAAPAAVETIAVAQPDLSLVGIGALAYLGIAASAATLFLWNSAVAAVGASTAGAFLNLIPAFGLAFAVLAGETVSLVQLGGGGAVVLGVWLAAARPVRGGEVRATRGR